MRAFDEEYGKVNEVESTRKICVGNAGIVPIA